MSQPRQKKRPASKCTHQSGSLHQVYEKEESYQETDSSEEENIFTSEKKADSKMPKVTVKINDIPVTMILDTGTSLDIIDEVTFHQLEQKEASI